jgi:OFA family oxalate/formate antiporter-like MFS transporter
MVGTVIASIGYGILLAVVAFIMIDFYGLKNYGVNYGILYTAWGVGGFIGPILMALSMDNLGHYSQAYLIYAGLVIFTTFLSF